MKRIRTMAQCRLFGILTILLLITPVSAQESAFTYDDGGKRDPFWPLVGESGNIISYETDFSISDLSLEGIMAGAEGTHIAIINGRIVRPGDTLGNFTILDVQPESVFIKQDNLKFELKLEKED
jgi:hypothetical protein